MLNFKFIYTLANRVHWYIFFVFACTIVSCTPSDMDEDDFVRPPDTDYDCRIHVLDINDDTLHRVDFPVLEGSIGLAKLEYSNIPGSRANGLTPLMYRQDDTSDNINVGEWEFYWQLKNFTLEEMGMNLNGDLKHDAKHVFQYMQQNKTTVNKPPHNVDLKILHTDSLGVRFRNSDAYGLEYDAADVRLIVSLINVDTLEIHGIDNNEYFTDVAVEAEFDGYLFTSDYQDSIYINGYYRVPISGLQWKRYDE